MKNRSLESTNGIPRKYATPAATEERTDFGGRVKGEKEKVTLKRLHQTKLQHPHLINLHPDLHTTD